MSDENAKKAASAPSSATREKHTNGVTKANTPAASLSIGSYKSNVFQFRLEDLLGNVRLKHGKKESVAEDALRTLKTIIEQIPSEGPLSVCTHFPFHFRENPSS